MAQYLAMLRFSNFKVILTLYQMNISISSKLVCRCTNEYLPNNKIFGRSYEECGLLLYPDIFNMGILLDVYIFIGNLPWWWITVRTFFSWTAPLHKHTPSFTYWLTAVAILFIMYCIDLQTHAFWIHSQQVVCENFML